MSGILFVTLTIFPNSYQTTIQDTQECFLKHTMVHHPPPKNTFVLLQASFFNSTLIFIYNHQPRRHLSFNITTINTGTKQSIMSHEFSVISYSNAHPYVHLTWLLQPSMAATKTEHLKSVFRLSVRQLLLLSSLYC